MGYKHISSLYDQLEQTLVQERVGNDENGILVKSHKRPNVGNDENGILVKNHKRPNVCASDGSVGMQPGQK
jgi:hypothetical protein